VSSGAAGGVASALASIRIVGARPKPKPLAEQLRDGKLEMTLESVMSFRQRGYFLTPAGRLLANEGEATVETERGLVYSLRFGEIVAGGARKRTAGGEDEEAATEEQGRYLFVTVTHDPEVQAKYGGADGGERTARFLNRKFADWYYVISGADFEKIRVK